MSKLYMKNSNGVPSASLTMAFVSFFLISSWLAFWVIGTTFGLHIPEFDATVAMGYMTPLLGLYFGRRWNDNQNATEVPAEEEVVEESTEVESESVEEETPNEEVVNVTKARKGKRV